MDIKYDASGQPLPWEQQAASQTETAQKIAPTKEFKVHDLSDQPDSDTEVQLANPFVQEYLKSQKQVQEAPIEPESIDVDPEPEEELVAAPARKEDHPNFKALRQTVERAERERDEYARLLRERELRDQSPRPTTTHDEIDDLDIPDDGFVEPKHLKKLYRELKETKRAQAEYKQKTAKELQEMMLYKQFPDIDQVVSPENIQMLTQMKPAYARQLAALHNAGDVYGVGELAYNYITDLGIHKKQTTPARDYTADKMRAQANASKPRPLASGASTKAESPLARAHSFAGELNEADMRKHYQEMEQAIRNRGD